MNRVVAAGLGVLLFAACAPRYRLVTHSSISAEGRMCEMQAQRARDYCRQLSNCIASDEWDPSDRKCNACMIDYADAFASCGGSIDKVCVSNCKNAEDRKLQNQTKN